MAQFAYPGWLRPSAAVLTVADLLSRNAPVPVEVLGNRTTPPLSVGSLLRREGRAPHALDRPVRTRAPRAYAHGDTTLIPRIIRPNVTGVVVKRGAIAAGALLAAGSIFGVTSLTDASAVGDQEPLTGPYAGQGGLDAGASTGSTPGVVISPAADTGGLDAGATAPSSWVPVAFPGALAGGTAPPAAQESPAARIPATPITGGGSGSPATGGTAGTGRSSAGSSLVGGGGGGAAGSAVDQVGTTASDNGKALGPTVDTVTQPVTSLLDPATEPVTSLVGGLVDGPLV